MFDMLRRGGSNGFMYSMDDAMIACRSSQDVGMTPITTVAQMVSSSKNPELTSPSSCL